MWPASGGRFGNGREPLVDRFMTWLGNLAIQRQYLQLRMSDQTVYMERLNRTFRHEMLDAYAFESLDQDTQDLRGVDAGVQPRAPMIPWPKCRPRRIRPGSWPEDLLWKCLLDRGAYTPDHSNQRTPITHTSLISTDSASPFRRCFRFISAGKDSIPARLRTVSHL